MTRRPPSIVNVVTTADGGIKISWEVDSFFPDSEAPEKIRVDLQGIAFSTLDGDTDSEEIPRATVMALNLPVVVVSVSFLWMGPPVEEQQSSALVPVQVGAGTGRSGVNPAAKPVVSVVHVQPRTRQLASNIRIHWQSNNYNAGKLLWGGPGNARAFERNIGPVGQNYQGTFTTDRPLVPATLYTFTVEVRNTLHSPGWLSTSIVVRSAPDYVSLRKFLIDTGTPVTASVRSLVSAGRSVRHLIIG